MASEPDELKASDLLPPDDPPADDGPKKIAERRVVGWFMADRLVRRAEWRPVGNSKHFWSKIEDDDPFVHRPPPRRVRQDHTLYPADRIDRIPSTAVPQPSRQAPQAPPRPRQEAPQPKREAPKPSVNRDPRVAPTPSTPQTPIQEESPPEPMERHLPPIQPPKRTKTGRIRISSAKERPHGHQGIVKRPTAAEIRAKKEAQREAGTLKDAPPPKLRKLDDVLGILGRLKQAEELHAQGLLDKESFDATQDDAPRPKPKRVAQPTSEAKPAPTAAPKPAPAPKPEAPPKPAKPAVDRTPPKPAAPKKKDEPKGPPRPPAGGMDDLFGAPSEGRVKIGKRTKPTAKPVDED